jgi:hypothetical protein
MNRLLIVLVAFFAIPSAAYGQGGVPASPIQILDSLGRPRAGATVTICTNAGSGIPCTPLASIFIDAGLTTPAANPLTTNGLGNLPLFYAAPGAYPYTITGTGITSFGPFTATLAGTGGGNVLSGSPNTFTAANTVTGLLSCKNFENIPCVDAVNSQGWSGSDYGAWVNSAIAGLPTTTPQEGGVGSGTFPYGTIWLFGSASNPNVTVNTGIVVNSPVVSLIGPGSNMLRLVAGSSLSTDILRVKTNPFNQTQGVVLRGFTLDCNNLSTVTSGLHYGDVMAGEVNDLKFQNCTGARAVAGLWQDNVLGFTERTEFYRIAFDNNTVNWKKTNNSSGCVAVDNSNSYETIIGARFRVYANQTGLEVGPGIHWSHVKMADVTMNGIGAGKTFFKMDAASGSCSAAGGNNGDYGIRAEDNGSGASAGGTFVNMATGTTLSGSCFFHNFNSSPAMTNSLHGTMGCQTYVGPSGNQWIASFAGLPSSDTATTIPLLGQGAPSMAALDLDLAQSGTVGKLWLGSDGNAGLFRQANGSGNWVVVNRLPLSFDFGGGTPTCTFTSGGGTSPSCAVDTGSTDQAGIIIATTGTGSPGSTGTITLTFANGFDTTFGANKPSCIYTLSDNGAGQWNARATVIDKRPSNTSDLFNWDNNAATLATSTAFWINYFCAPK